MAKAEDVIKIAIGELGYHEKASNSQLDSKTANSGSNNFTKYARDLDAIPNFYNGKKLGYAWCALWTDHVHYVACNKDVKKTLYEICQPEKSTGAGTLESYRFYKNAGRSGKEPKLGADIFFTNNSKESGIHHTGIVEKFDNNYVFTIEGNTSNCVARRTYKRNSPSIYGYGYPRYDVEPTGNGMNSSTPVTKNNPIKTVDMSTLTNNVVAKGTVTNTSSLNVRKGPGTKYDRLTKVPSINKGTEVGICCAVKADNDKLWYFVLINNTTYGFVSSSYIEVFGNNNIEDDSGKYTTR